MATKPGQSGQLMGIPWRFALAMQNAGWILRSDVIWAKKSCMPESLSGTRWERCRVKTKAQGHGTQGSVLNGGPRTRDMSNGQYLDSAEYSPCPGCDKCLPNGGYVLRNGSWRCTGSHEHIFQFVKGMGYFSDGEAVKVNGTMRRNNEFRGGGTYTNGRVSRDEYKKTFGGEYLGEAGANRRNVWNDLKPEPYGQQRIARYIVLEKREYGDDIYRKELPDCPVHGSPHQLHPTLSDDAPQSVSAVGSGNIDTGDYHAQVPTGGSEGVAQTSFLGSHPSIGDCSLQEGSPSATVHSKRTRRRGRAHIPSRPDTASPQIASRTEHIEGIPVESVLEQNMDENNKKLDTDHPSSGMQTSGYIDDKQLQPCEHPLSADCICLLYRKVTELTSHYATFPPDLPRLCIQASTSEAGVCAKCGSQWARLVEVEQEKLSGSKGVGLHTPDGNNWQGVHDRTNKLTRTLSWRATCPCHAAKTPAVVLDPFAGTGTTCLAAMRLGRRSVGVDLSAEYLGMAVKRLSSQTLPMPMEVNK